MKNMSLEYQCYLVGATIERFFMDKPIFKLPKEKAIQQGFDEVYCTVNDDGSTSSADTIEQIQEWIADVVYDKGLASNMFCDNYGYCCGDSCPKFKDCY